MGKKYKIIVSDFHMGGGRKLANGSSNYLENFFFDQEFVELLQHYSQAEWAKRDVELILNGDFFEHLQVDPSEKDPDMITQKVAVRRQQRIIDGHAIVFAAMVAFNKKPHHKIIFNLGNHDAGLLWPGVQSLLKTVIGGDVSVYLEPYQVDGVRIEHGHRYQSDSSFNEERYFLKKGLDEEIINLPWGCYFVMHIVNKVRKERPYFAHVHPMRYFWRWAMINEPLFAIKYIAMILYYFVSLRFVHSKRRHSSFWRTLKIMKQLALDQNLDSVAKKILLTDPDLRILVMGHTHGSRYLNFAANKLYINTGTWTEWLSLDPARLGRVVRLTYAYIEIDNKHGPQGWLKEWLGPNPMIRDLSHS
jgi:UDP-2,3-diacylglucosamine pyrophosphatase LpxH